MRNLIFFLLFAAFLIPVYSQEEVSLSLNLPRLGLENFGLHSSSEFGTYCFSKLGVNENSTESDRFISDTLILLPAARSESEIIRKRNTSKYKTPIINPPGVCYGRVLDPYFPEQYSLIIVDPE